MTDSLKFAIAAFVMLGVGALMIFYEWIRIKAKRPIFGGRQVQVLYWIAYLSLLTLGGTSAIAAVVR